MTWEDKVVKRARECKPAIDAQLDWAVNHEKAPRLPVAADDELALAAAAYVFALFFGASDVEGSWEGPGSYELSAEISATITIRCVRQ